MIDFTDVLLLCLYNHDCLFPDRCDEMAQRKVEPINETCHSCLIFSWPRFLCTILLCQKSFLKVSSKWLLKNKSDNGKLLLGKTYSGECFRAILALLFEFSLISSNCDQTLTPRCGPLVIPLQTCFQGYTGISRCVRPSLYLSVYPSVYKMLLSVKTMAGVLSHIK